MKQIASIFLSCFLSCLPLYALLGQTYPAPGPGRQARTPSGPTFVQYTYVTNTSSSTSSITSPSITVTANDWILVACGQAGTATSMAASSSGSGYSWTQRTLQVHSGNTAIQVSWAIAPSTATVTYTCTPNTSMSAQNMVVLDFSGTGTTVETGAGGLTGNSTTYNTNNFSTTQRTYVVYCGEGNTFQGPTVFTAGTVAGNTASLLGVDHANLTTASTIACEGYLSTGALTTVYATMTGSVPMYLTYDIIPVNY